MYVILIWHNSTYQNDRVIDVKRTDLYHYTDGGLRNVWLANGYEIKKTPYGYGVVFHNLDGLTQSICIALSRKASRFTGAEFRYIRSAGMLPSQPALCKSMGIDGHSVVRCEKNSQVSHLADKLVRLLYTDQAEGNELIAKAVERIKSPNGHFKFPHLWPVKFPQAGRVDYQSSSLLRARRAAASLSL